MADLAQDKSLLKARNLYSLPLLLINLYMQKSITRSDFSDAFRDMGRATQFSYDGLTALYDYFTEYEGDTGCTIELDVIAICCEYAEYADVTEAFLEYNEEIICGED